MRALRCLLLALALPTASASWLRRRRPSQIAHLNDSFSQVKRDLPVIPLLSACEDLATAMRALGQTRSAQELEKNIGKVDRKSHRTVEELLRYEKSLGIHGKGGGLKDPSSAMGLLWIRRALAFQLKWYELILASDDVSPGVAAMQAYEAELEPYHGWALRKIYRTALSATAPKDTETMLHRMDASSLPTEDIRLDLLTLLATWSPLVSQWKKLHIQLDLEDTRQS